MTQTSAYMAKTDKFIQKTDAFMDKTEMRMQNKKLPLSLWKTSSEPTNREQKRETTVANSKETSDTDIPASTDTPASADKDHNIPPEPKVAEITSAAPQPRRDTLEEQKPLPPFPQRLRKQKQEYQYKKFFDILKQIHINLPLVEALQQMPNYAKFLKDMVSRKTRIREFEIVAATEVCLAMMHNKVPAKKTALGALPYPAP
ncbi:hypothetical protein V6N13_043452 [Hibiscus sabdariffa]